jgi:hypothetical protein
MRFAAPNRTISFIAIVVMTVLILLNLGIYAGIFNPQPVPDQQQLSLPGLPDQTQTVRKSTVKTSPNQMLQRLAPIIIFVTVVLGIGIITAIVLQRNVDQKRSRDKKRIQDLADLANTFEAYYMQHGHYPVSSTYDSKYYSAINILTEWSSYNFPSAEEMRVFNPNWPPSDPNFSPTAEDQAGNYLYYPHHFGQRFSLYAQLEAPTQHPVPDYNTIDNLPETFGKYNYRFNGPDHHVEAPASQNPHQPIQAPASQ